MLETGAKIGPLENTINEKVVGYKYTAPDFEKMVNANIVLFFESGKKLFMSSMTGGDEHPTILFFAPEDCNAHTKSK